MTKASDRHHFHCLADGGAGVRGFDSPRHYLLDSHFERRRTMSSQRVNDIALARHAQKRTLAVAHHDRADAASRQQSRERGDALIQLNRNDLVALVLEYSGDKHRFLLRNAEVGPRRAIKQARLRE